MPLHVWAIPLAIFHGLEKVDFNIGISVIDLPTPCWEELLYRIEERWVWWKEHICESWIIHEPFSHKNTMVETYVVPNNNIKGCTSLWACWKGASRRPSRKARRRVLYGPRVAWWWRTPCLLMAAQSETLPPRWPGPSTRARWTIMFRPLRLRFARLNPASHTYQLMQGVTGIKLEYCLYEIWLHYNTVNPVLLQ